MILYYYYINLLLYTDRKRKKIDKDESDDNNNNNKQPPSKKRRINVNQKEKCKKGDHGKIIKSTNSWRLFPNPKSDKCTDCKKVM